MFLTRRAWIAQAAAIGAPALAASAPPTLLMVNTIYPPFVFPPGHPAGEGLDVEIAREALRRCGLGLRVELLPWKRVLRSLEDGQADFTTTISRQPERDAYLRWSVPYRPGASYIFLTRRAEAPRIQRLADIDGLRLGVVIGFRYPPAIVEHPGVRLEPGRDLRTLVSQLEAGRIDAIVVTAVAGSWEVQAQRLGQRLLRQPYEYASDSPNYFGFARSRVSAAQVEAISAALTALQRDGGMARIEARYLG